LPSRACHYFAEQFGLSEREVRLALSVFNGDKLLQTYKDGARTLEWRIDRSFLAPDHAKTVRIAEYQALADKISRLSWPKLRLLDAYLRGFFDATREHDNAVAHPTKARAFKPFVVERH
jgi:hypothetical protein